MKRLQLIKSNQGDNPNERYYFNIANSFDGSSIEIAANVVKISSDSYSIDSKLELLEKDVLTETYVSYFKDGERFRIVKPNRQFIPIIGDSISIASMNKSGYAVHYNLI